MYILGYQVFLNMTNPDYGKPFFCKKKGKVKKYLKKRKIGKNNGK